MLYNFFQKNKLNHNVRLFQKIGLNKKYYSPISSEDFKNIDPNLLKSDFNAVPIKETQIFKESSDENKISLEQYDELGFSVLRNYLTSEQVDEINHEIDKLLDEKVIKLISTNRIMFAIHQSKLLRKIGSDPKLIELLSSLMGEKMNLFQSINFLMGSQQKTHSDSIHMTTFPLGGLQGVWIALEDIDAENGALHYYPKSHKTPYYLNSDYKNIGTKWMLGKNDYTAYENMLENKISEMNLEKKVFEAKKGDLLIWHANLLHGGEPHINKNRTRKSMVFHYYSSDRICYHEITQRPALL